MAMRRRDDAKKYLNASACRRRITIGGLDMNTWNTDGQITHVKFMVRPPKAAYKLHELMGRMLQAEQQQ